MEPGCIDSRSNTVIPAGLSPTACPLMAASEISGVEHVCVRERQRERERRVLEVKLVQEKRMQRENNKTTTAAIQLMW